MANKRVPGRRSAEEAARTRERILDRAETLFAGSGYRGVSIRRLAECAGVRPFTVQHHFGSKLELYQTVLCRWDETLMKRLGEIATGGGTASGIVERILDDLFDFFLERREWVALNARARLGEGLPDGVAGADPGWLRFVETAVESRALVGANFDLRLLLITVEGILNQHVLADGHYRNLFGEGLGDRALRDAVRDHFRRVVLALLAPPIATRAEAPA